MLGRFGMRHSLSHVCAGFFARSCVIPLMFCVLSLLQVKEAKVTEAKINEAREHYRPAAARASLLYFIMNDLNKIHPMYQFSLKVPSLLTCHVSWRALGGTPLHAHSYVSALPLPPICSLCFMLFAPLLLCLWLPNVVM